MFYFFKTIFKIIGFALILYFSFIIPAGAETAKIDKLKKDAASINKKIKKNKDRLKDFTKKELDVVDTLNKVDISLHLTKKKAAILHKDLTDLEKQNQSVQKQYNDLQKQIEINEIYVSRRISGLYKLACLGKLHILVNADSIIDFFQRKRALEQILDYDNKIINNLKNQKIECRKMADIIAERKQEYLKLEKKYKTQASLLKYQQKKRKKLLKKIREKKSLTKASLACLRKSSKKLDRKIKSLQASRRKNEKKSPAGSFKSFKGLLKMPVKGKIVSFFGPYKNTEFNVMNIQSGIDIKADSGTPVHCVMEGEIIYSSWFKGYGNMVIIDHGDNYYTLYAHVEELYKHKGDKVLTGETIATVGDSGSMSGPMLHFEIRHHGKPVDPGKWLKKG